MNSTQRRIDEVALRLTGLENLYVGPPGDRRVCGKTSPANLWRCTREVNHNGPHVAHFYSSYHSGKTRAQCCPIEPWYDSEEIIDGPNT